jgi:predicted nuclease of predicted toxin-antitoxin system
VLGDLPGDIRHFCQSPRKNVIVVPEDVDELAFLFGAKPALIWMVLVRSSASICTTLASSPALVPDMESMARLVKESGALRHNTFSSVVVTMVVASLMLLYS